MILELFDNPVFKQFQSEIGSLGFHISDSPSAGSQPYAVICGRSNARWWLVPLTNRHVATSGLALFQPIIPSAKVLKTAATTLSAIGLSKLWAKVIVHVSCPPVFSELFKCDDLGYSFFTGTDSPHRKAAVQIMDRAGNIKGYAKISSNPAVVPLLTHEATTLTRLQALELQSVLIPVCLFSGKINGTQVLVTDSLKTPKTKADIALKQDHIDFLSELAGKTISDEENAPGWASDELRSNFAAVASSLSDAWQRRLEKAISVVNTNAVNSGPKCLTHGDFTPWNTFFVGGKLYVFDWEYASIKYPVGYDLIHYVLSLPPVKRQPLSATIKQVREVLRDGKIAGDDRKADVLFLCYLCWHSLHYVAREIKVDYKVVRWDGEQETAGFMDSLLETL